jgi:hypothetical protein
VTLAQLISRGLTGAAFVAAIVSGAVAAGAQPTASQFGTPPSGEIPILYNDQHVYATPDRLKANRVLAALIRKGVILMPLRSMFEAMGASVNWDQSALTADVSKSGIDVKVTVGRPEVIINGESRPLDVPPEIYRGVVVVPVRVISEAMGAYVQWVPDKRVVVVRYVPVAPPPPPTAPPPPPPTPKVVPYIVPARPSPPPPTPAPKPAPQRHDELYLAGDYMFIGKVYNEWSPGNNLTRGVAVRGAVEIPKLPLMLAGDYRSFTYPHLADNPFTNCSPPVGNPACVTVIGGWKQQAYSSGTLIDTDFDGRLGLRVAEPRIYIGVGYLHRQENYGYPPQNGFGFGAEKLPDLNQPLSVYGSVWYYPVISGDYTFPSVAPLNVAGQTFPFQQRFLKYQAGATLNLGNTGLFLDAGFLGDTIRGVNLSPSDATHAAGYAGLGIKF